ncbi:hypothetical protein [Janthinobacterium aquaticum]|uniref:hypothetical protein n=1 Tax=Janthinobacterium sp. FT58W TaxID=2654254 RepID=UPI001264B834|nr:hypothetical protein [Janthinobacterium sp. FT58W]KAB8041888.1 hypothetical protein GCM43_16950 [Janthinobacterium sp. FT58W]
MPGAVTSGGGFGAGPTQLRRKMLASLWLAHTADYTVNLFPESYFQSPKRPACSFLANLVATAQIRRVSMIFLAMKIMAGGQPY